MSAQIQETDNPLALNRSGSNSKSNEGEKYQQQENQSQDHEKQQKQKQQQQQQQTGVKVPMSQKKKIIIGVSVFFGIVLLGWIIFFIYSFIVYGSLWPEEYGDDDPVFQGYDIVEYYNIDQNDKGVKGDSKFESEYDNAYFWFKNQENKDKFDEEPEKYLPQMGAFCTWGIQDDNENIWNRDKLGPPCEPDRGWKVYKGKLYCNASEKLSKEFFEEDKADDNVEFVEKLWVKWFGSLGPKAGYYNNRCFASNPRFCQQKQQDFNQGPY